MFYYTGHFAKLIIAWVDLILFSLAMWLLAWLPAPLRRWYPDRPRGDTLRFPGGHSDTGSHGKSRPRRVVEDARSYLALAAMTLPGRCPSPRAM